MGIFLLLLMIGMELFFTVTGILKKWDMETFRKWRLVKNGAETGIVLIMLFTPLLQWDFQYKMFLYLLLLRLVLSAITYLKHYRRAQKNAGASMLTEDADLADRINNISAVRLIFKMAGSVILLFVILIPAFLFPQSKELEPDGSHEVATESFIWTDNTRKETFEEDGSNREVPVQFWYPKDGGSGETYPLVVFSHGSFGYRMSNHSTFEELASNGYVVCSMDHPYHSFFTEDTSGKTITVNPQFLQDVMDAEANKIPEEKIFEFSKEWLNLRAADMNFVVDTIEEKKNTKEPLFEMIDYDKIGVMGHSLGGAAAVSLGRSRTDIDAVINLDGTMISEKKDLIDGKYVFESEAYPVPIYNIENEEHHKEAQEYGALYVNNEVMENALDGKQTYFVGAGHLNFTDLPLVSKPLASLLGVGTIDERTCIETMNKLILEYYDHYLKGEGTLDIPEGVS